MSPVRHQGPCLGTISQGSRPPSSANIHNSYNQNLVLQTPTHSNLEPPTTSKSQSSLSPVASRISNSSLSPGLLSISPLPASSPPSSSNQPSTSLQFYQYQQNQVTIQQPQKRTAPLRKTSSFETKPLKIAPAPTPGYRNLVTSDNHVMSSGKKRNAQQMLHVDHQMVQLQQSPTVQGLLIQASPVLLVQPVVEQPKIVIVQQSPDPSTSSTIKAATPIDIQEISQFQQPKSSMKEVKVTSSRDIDDEEIPTRSINLENLNCARSLVVFPPTLLKARRNLLYDDHDDEEMYLPSMSRMSMLGTEIMDERRPSPELQLSPSISSDMVPPSVGSVASSSSLAPGLTPAQLKRQMRLQDASFLQPDTRIDDIEVGKLLASVRSCRERRIRFGVSQQAVADFLVPVHGEAFRQSSICKLENLSLKLDAAARMVAILEPFYDEKESEWEVSSSKPIKQQKHERNQRYSFSDEAREFLKSMFTTNPYPSRKSTVEIAAKIGAPKDVVRVWFANRRLDSNKRLRSEIAHGAQVDESKLFIARPKQSRIQSQEKLETPTGSKNQQEG